MKILNAYQYFYYKIYKLIEDISVPRFWTDWKTSALIIMLEIFVCNSLEVLYHYWFNIPMKTKGFQRIGIEEVIVILLLLFINYYCFEYQDKWKEIIVKFDNLPKKKNKIGGFIVWGIVLFILLFYWFYIIDLLSVIAYE